MCSEEVRSLLWLRREDIRLSTVEGWMCRVWFCLSTMAREAGLPPSQRHEDEGNKERHEAPRGGIYATASTMSIMLSICRHPQVHRPLVRRGERAGDDRESGRMEERHSWLDQRGK